MIYFDDTVLPLHGMTDEIGLELAAHFYNSSIQWHGRNEAVMNAKHLTRSSAKRWFMISSAARRRAFCPSRGRPTPASATGITSAQIFEQHQYKSAATVIPMLADIVSKNGNLMLSVPVRGDGSIDADEVKIVGDIGAWLKVNGEAIYATRPWKVFGEGPSTKAFEKGQFDGQSDTHKTPFTPEDIRFTSQRMARRFTPSSSRFRRTARSPSIAGGKFPAVARQDRQRPDVGRPRQIEIRPRRKRIAPDVAGQKAVRHCLRVEDHPLNCGRLKGFLAVVLGGIVRLRAIHLACQFASASNPIVHVAGKLHAEAMPMLDYCRTRLSPT